MRPSRLYIENFMCYDNAYIDFNEFSAALIVGKAENPDVSNGVGKTTIFNGAPALSSGSNANGAFKICVEV